MSHYSGPLPEGRDPVRLVCIVSLSHWKPTCREAKLALMNRRLAAGALPNGRTIAFANSWLSHWHLFGIAQPAWAAGLDAS